ncbi:hypothetical protein TTHERM_02416110 (macronuclear) [Tetrahymena thermophila SB210]|nr:hypothetical protein TTHERM_02416110 [Tetrahymena thermophila SB210]EAR80764.1 hypothetical protein TTHERM_02416110 [Tetrahymena thermophila SB210]|eukprot:XP_001028427.1 hypothetical protein TTHERM_02416110 [Tetrahymena thermophila SB210]
MNSLNSDKINKNNLSNFTEQNEFSSIKLNNKSLIKQRLNLTYYEREMVQQKQFNSLVSSQIWVRLQPRHKETKNSFL